MASWVLDGAVYIAPDDSVQSTTSSSNVLVSTGDTIMLATQRSPAATDPGNPGEICWSSTGATTFLHLCSAIDSWTNSPLPTQELSSSDSPAFAGISIGGVSFYPLSTGTVSPSSPADVAGVPVPTDALVSVDLYLVLRNDLAAYGTLRYQFLAKNDSGVLTNLTANALASTNTGGAFDGSVGISAAGTSAVLTLSTTMSGDATYGGYYTVTKLL